MKIKLFIIVLAISLMSTKCAEKYVYISFENKSSRNVMLSCTKKTDSLNKIISKHFSHDFSFKYLYKHTFKKDTLVESNLGSYSHIKLNFYTFYFLRVIKYDSIKKKNVFEKKYDSINISEDKIKIGEGHKNSLIYDEKKIVFKSI
jgi:hypothetical protein